MTLSVFDVRSNRNDQIAHAVKVLGRAKQRIAVFRAIYHGKQASKTVNEIAAAAGLDRIRVLQEGKRLADNGIVNQVRAAGITAYQKDSFYSATKAEILRYVRDRIAFERLPTKTRPRATQPKEITIRIPRKRIQARYISLDDIDSFSRVTKVSGDVPAAVEFGRVAAAPVNTLRQQPHRCQEISVCF